MTSIRIPVPRFPPTIAKMAAWIRPDMERRGKLSMRSGRSPELHVPLSRILAASRANLEFPNRV